FTNLISAFVVYTKLETVSSMLTPPEKLSVIQQGFSTRWQAMTKRNFPYFPHDYLTRAKIRENTYHFTI
uniref:hypothetical protein n=1 Tax=Lachnospira sp. TaxID=2049031 RepID=UPI003FEF662A